MRQPIGFVVPAFIGLLLVPAVASAQASIAGVVTDASGGVLPGVTVEAASPALIERVRVAVTDATGQYRIIQLARGTYTVTFTLTGFRPVRREGLELTGSFTATVSTQLSVGGIEETITVSGEAPVVDVTSTKDLRAAGLTAPNPILKSWEVNPGFGGPIRTDRLWFFTSIRQQGFDKGVTNLFENANAYDPTKWTYQPDLSRQVVRDRRWLTGNVRLTTQVTPRNKVQLYWQEQALCPGCNNGFTESPFSSVEANVTGELRPQRPYAATWTSPVTSRFLLDFGVGGAFENWSSRRRDPRDANLIRVTELCAACPANLVPTAPFTYRAQNTTSNWNWDRNGRGSASYVTGTHALKLGFQGAHYAVETENFTNQWMTYTLFGGNPISIGLDGGPARTSNRTRFLALYVQDQWTRGRLTLQGAVRYDRAWSYSPEQVRGGTTVLPDRVTFPYTKGIDAWNDITPRMGLATICSAPEGRRSKSTSASTWRCRNLDASDFTEFALNAPVDARLPGGGGYAVGPLYNVDPDRFAVAPDNVTYSTDEYGNQTLYWHGVDVNVNARRGNLTFQGGTSTGRTVSDVCDIRAAVPESDLLDPNCRLDLPWLT